MKVGDLQLKIAKYINLEPNRFIMTVIGENHLIFIINVDDNVFRLIKSGIQYFRVHDHIYDVDFTRFKKFRAPMKDFLFYNQDFDFHMYFPEQMTVKAMKQIILDRTFQLFNKNVGMEFEITEGFLFDTIIASSIENKKVIHVYTFNIEKKDYALEYDG
jgi:hypothetical protein